jgi:hypothetical protein
MNPDQQQIRTLLHDLRGPGITLKGFVDEMMLMADEFATILDDPSIAGTSKTQLAALLDQDLLPSLRCLRIVEQQLNTRIVQAETLLGRSE